MPWNNAMMVISANAQRAAATHMQLHSGDPGAAGTANVTTAARQPVTWTTPTNDGDYTLGANVNFTGVASGGATTWISFWSASSGGTWYGNFALSGDAVANSAGEYTVNAGSINGSAT